MKGPGVLGYSRSARQIGLFLYFLCVRGFYD